MSNYLNTVYDKPDGQTHRRPVQNYQSFVQGLQAIGTVDEFQSQGGLQRAKKAMSREEEIKRACEAESRADFRRGPGTFRDVARLPESKDTLLHDIDARQRRDTVRRAYARLCDAEADFEDRKVLSSPSKPVRAPGVISAPIPDVRGGRAAGSPAPSTPTRSSRVAAHAQGFTDALRSQLQRETLDYNKSVMDAAWERRSARGGSRC
eukprot:tig00000857_g4929.t1